MFELRVKAQMPKCLVHVIRLTVRTLKSPSAKHNSSLSMSGTGVLSDSDTTAKLVERG